MRLSALLIFSVGLFKKLIFADQIAVVINPIFKEPGNWTAPEYLLAVFGFSMQIERSLLNREEDETIRVTRDL